ncbi:hypothetical protein BGW36DRAFT_25438 [Talaromyces proteolyticus]|uniref:Uncharacterized protein n=1 Tax=Talaromyces proteolyticus TaxID=1131652 RepID=A0AAD4KPJ5_9EURO|nr:uncharacterized protein BGW36DRAFT_25438 [Talaromyces proteolyticus]KAH8692694.1 hypothetical protein BGW36DRAFT_25438 [Talaromyces proteolyticus]
MHAFKEQEKANEDMELPYHGRKHQSNSRTPLRSLSSTVLALLSIGLLLSPVVATALRYNPSSTTVGFSGGVIKSTVVGIVEKRGDVGNLQSYTGDKGGLAPPINRTNDPMRPFAVGNNTFTDLISAGQRSCNIQFNKCQRAANQNTNISYTVSDCQTQKSSCFAAQGNVNKAVASTGSSSESTSTSTSLSTSTSTSLSTTSTSASASASTSTSTSTSASSSTSILATASTTTSSVSSVSTTTAPLITTSSASSTTQSTIQYTTITQNQDILKCEL